MSRNNYTIRQRTLPLGLVLAKTQGAFLYQRNNPTDQGGKRK
nr:MAG TPA: hypothetical protein [Caudoviricetes sp.]